MIGALYHNWCHMDPSKVTTRPYIGLYKTVTGIANDIELFSLPSSCPQLQPQAPKIKIY